MRTDKLFEGRHFDREVIILCVRWYLRFKLGFRDLVEMTAKRGLSMAHTTIRPFRNAAVTIAGVELIHRIRKGQFDLSKLRLKETSAPAVWNAVLATQ